MLCMGEIHLAGKPLEEHLPVAKIPAQSLRDATCVENEQGQEDSQGPNIRSDDL